MITSPGISMTLASLSPLRSRSDEAQRIFAAACRWSCRSGPAWRGCPRRSSLSPPTAIIASSIVIVGAVAAARPASSVAPDDAHLLAEGAGELIDDHRDQRLGDVLRQLQADVLGQHRRGLADRGHVGDQRRGDAARRDGTWTLAPSSSLRQTWIVSSSSGPMTYSSPGPPASRRSSPGPARRSLPLVAQPASSRQAAPTAAARRAEMVVRMGPASLRNRAGSRGVRTAR